MLVYGRGWKRAEQLFGGSRVKPAVLSFGLGLVALPRHFCVCVLRAVGIPVMPSAS